MSGRGQPTFGALWKSAGTTEDRKVVDVRTRYQTECERDWSAEYNVNHPAWTWRIAAKEAEFWMMGFADMKGECQRGIIRGVLQLNCDEAWTEHYCSYLNNEILEHPIHVDEPPPGWHVQVQRGLALVNIDGLLRETCHALDNHERRVMAAGGLPSFEHLHQQRDIERIIGNVWSDPIERTEFVDQTIRSYTRAIRDYEAPIDLVIEGAGTDAQRRELLQFCDDRGRLVNWSKEIGVEKLIEIHHAIVVQLVERQGESTTEGLTRAFCHFVECLSELIPWDDLEMDEYPSLRDEEAWRKA